jgi:hypothetical protein
VATVVAVVVTEEEAVDTVVAAVAVTNGMS